MGAAYFAVLAAATAVYIVLQGTALKIVASALFLAGAAVFVIMSRVRAQKGYPAFGWLALAAAALCFAGDAAIEFHFLAGMVLFGAGHIVYIAAFQQLNSVGWRTVLPSALVGAFALCWLLLYPAYDFGSLLPAVIAYAVVISCMLGRAFGVALDATLDKNCAPRCFRAQFYSLFPTSSSPCATLRAAATSFAYSALQPTTLRSIFLQSPSLRRLQAEGRG